MRKILSKIAGLALGLSLAAGVGVSLASKKVSETRAADSYEKLTAAPSDWSGEYLLAYDVSATSAKLWTGVDQSNSYVSATVSSNKITTVPSGAVTLTISAMSGGYSVKVNGGTNNGKFIYGTSGSNKTNFGTSASLNTFSYSSGVLMTSNTSVMRFNNGTNNGQWFRYYKAASYTGQQVVQLYKKVASECTHNWVAGEVHAPTCTEAGYTEYECSICHEGKHDDVVAATGHDYGSWTVTTAATCLTAGEQSRVCNNDSSHIETQPIPALGHSYVNHICERCGAAEPSEAIASMQVSEYATANSWVNQSQYLTMNLNSVVTATVTGGANSGKYYSADSSWRLYSSESAKLTFTTANDEELISATLTFLSSDSPVIQFAGSNVTSGTAVVLSGSSAEFSVTSGKAHFTTLSVTYAGEQETTYTITYLANAEDAEGSMSPTTAASPQVAACSFTRDGYEFARWNTQPDGEGDDYAVGTTILEDITLYVIWQEYIAPIGANVTMTGVTNASSVTVNGHAGIKCGTGKAGGEMTLTLNEANITKIKVYVAGWSTDSTDVSVSIDNGTISESSLSLTSDSNISGNVSAFTLAGDETLYSFTLIITNAPVDSVITLSTSAKEKRFVVWGATDLFAESFANEFSSNLTCDATGENGPSFTSGHDWTTMNSFYNGLDAEEKGRLHDATFTVSGSGSSTVVTATGDTVQSVAEAMARYDYIIAKYGTSEYTNFIGHTKTKMAPARMIGDTISSSSSTIIIVVVALTSITSIGVLLVIKRRRSLVK